MEKQAFVNAAVINLILRQMVGQGKSITTFRHLFLSTAYEGGYPKGRHLHCSCLTLGEIRSPSSPQEETLTQRPGITFVFSLKQFQILLLPLVVHPT